MQPSSDERHVRGRRLRYRTWGAASVPPLVLLGAAGGNLEAVAATLADNWRVIAYDGAEPDNGVEALTDLVDVLGLDRPALAAWGDGVHLALGFAAAHPARVAALALFPDGEASGVAALSDAAAFSVLLSPTAVPGAEVLARLTAFLEPVHTALRSRRATARPLDLL